MHRIGDGNFGAFIASAGRTLQMAAISMALWSFLALLLAPAYYQCWWIGRAIGLVSRELRFRFEELERCAWWLDMPEFQVHLLLSGIVWIPLASLLTGWFLRKAPLNRVWRLAGVFFGLWFYAAIAPAFLFWLAGKT